MDIIFVNIELKQAVYKHNLKILILSTSGLDISKPGINPTNQTKQKNSLNSVPNVKILKRLTVVRN
jgi:hypothetical protein